MILIKNILKLNKEIYEYSLSSGSQIWIKVAIIKTIIKVKLIMISFINFLIGFQNKFTSDPFLIWNRENIITLSFIIKSI